MNVIEGGKTIIPFMFFLGSSIASWQFACYKAFYEEHGFLPSG
jgi:hypothetical protein